MDLEKSKRRFAIPRQFGLRNFLIVLMVTGVGLGLLIPPIQQGKMEIAARKQLEAGGMRPSYHYQLDSSKDGPPGPKWFTRWFDDHIFARIGFVGIYCNESLIDLSAIKDLTSIEELDIRDCEKLKEIGDLKGLLNLETINLYYCPSLTNVDVLHRLKRLKKIGLFDCEKLTPQQIQELRASLPNTEIQFEVFEPTD